jgi:hypothetical protein
MGLLLGQGDPCDLVTDQIARKAADGNARFANTHPISSNRTDLQQGLEAADYLSRN